MKRRIAPAVALGILAFAASCAPDGGPTAVNPASQLSAVASASSNNGVGKYDPELNGPADAKVHRIRGFENAASNSANFATRRSPNMTYHNGLIMPSTTVRAIFWGTSWGSYSGDKITGMDLFYAGYGGSAFAGSNTEYSDNTHKSVTTVSIFQGHLIDSSAASGGGSTSAILAAVCRNITSPVSNGYYPVYTDIPRGSAGYCAWHSSGTCGGVQVTFAFFWKLDGDTGCDPQDLSTGHTQGLAAIANVSAHELSEAVTDPYSTGAWYDSQGYENSDKCAWVFHTNSNVFSNGTAWKVQGNWSNAAYTAGTGFANSSGQKGCADGY